MGAVRFSIPERVGIWARDAIGATTFIETGTNRAATALWAADHFSSVVTIEGQPELHAAAAAQGRRNMRFILGDSRTALAPVLSDTTGPAVLWLDAHWCGQQTYGTSSECPVLAELDAVDRLQHEHIILIDDARLFTAPPPSPHRAEDWPGMVELAFALSPAHRPRYAAICDDVIVAVPQRLAPLLIEFVRAEAERSKPVPIPPQMPVGWAARMLRRFRR